MNNLIKKAILISQTLSVLLLISCSEKDIVEPNPEPVYSTVFKDKLFKNGFNLRSTNEANHGLVGKLDYDGQAIGNPVWNIGQWNCINNDLLDANYNFVNNQHEYLVGTNGNKVTVNTTDGTITLELNTSTEYGLNGITHDPRREGEPWPTLLLEYEIPKSEIVKISDKQEIRMKVDYNVHKLEDKMMPSTTNPDLHSAQFQWFITVQNRNVSSVEFGRYIWFGFNFQDKRFDYAPYYAAQDGGKENNTGAFIYMPDMRPLMSSQGKAELNKEFSVDIDVLPIIREAFDLAQKRNFLTKTIWEDLYIGASNIGWEVTGTYDVAVDIHKIDIVFR